MNVGIVNPPDQTSRRTNRAEFRRSSKRWLIRSVPVSVVVVLYLIPLAIMVVFSFGRMENFAWTPDWNVESYTRFIESPALWRVLVRSFVLAGMMTVICILIAYPVALWLALKAPRRMVGPILLLMILPAGTSFLIRTYTWILLLGANGFLNGTLESLGVIDEPLSLVFNTTGVLIALVYIFLPWTLLPIYVAAERIPADLLEASSVLGARSLRTLFRVILPLTAPGLLAAVLIGFVPAISMFAIPLIIGGPDSFLFANAIAQQFDRFNLVFGSALSVVMLVITVIVIAVLGRIASRFGLGGLQS